MIKIAICEDEETYAGEFTEYLNKYGRETGQEFKITRFTDGDEIVENYKPEYDIILLDIKMRFMDGMTAAENIRKVDPQVIIIFITNMIQYAIKGYAVSALDYIEKPVSYFDFSKSIERAIERLPKDDRHFIVVSNKEGTKKINVKSLKYVESQGHNLIFHTKNENISTTATIKGIEEELVNYHFIRCNKGYIVNLSFVDGVRDNCAEIENELLPISRARKNDFMKALAEYIGEET